MREQEKKKYIKQLKHRDIFDPTVLLYGGFGVESNSDETRAKFQRLSGYLRMINKIKQDGISKGKGTQEIQNEIKANINKDILTMIIGNKNVVYEHDVVGYEIDKMLIGNSKIRVNYDNDNNALIGMYIIKDLNTSIFTAGDTTYLVAIRRDEPDQNLLNRKIHDIYIDETIVDLSEQTIMSNYIHDLIK